MDNYYDNDFYYGFNELNGIGDCGCHEKPRCDCDKKDNFRPERPHNCMRGNFCCVPVYCCDCMKEKRPAPRPRPCEQPCCKKNNNCCCALALALLFCGCC